MIGPAMIPGLMPFELLELMHLTVTHSLHVLGRSVSVCQAGCGCLFAQPRPCGARHSAHTRNTRVPHEMVVTHRSI